MNHRLIERWLCEDDGVIFLHEDVLAHVIGVAETIKATEQRQAAVVGAGRTFRSQTSFGNYLAKHPENPLLGARENLRSLGGASEE